MHSLRDMKLPSWTSPEVAIRGHPRPSSASWHKCPFNFGANGWRTDLAFATDAAETFGLADDIMLAHEDSESGKKRKRAVTQEFPSLGKWESSLPLVASLAALINGSNIKEMALKLQDFAHPTTGQGKG